MLAAIKVTSLDKGKGGWFENSGEVMKLKIV